MAVEKQLLSEQALYHWCSILNVRPDATEQQLVQSYRRLISRWHPDRNSSHDAARRFQQVRMAYQHIVWYREQQAELKLCQAHAQASLRCGPRLTPGQRRFNPLMESQYKGTRFNMSA